MIRRLERLRSGLVHHLHQYVGAAEDGPDPPGANIDDVERLSAGTLSIRAPGPVASEAKSRYRTAAPENIGDIPVISTGRLPSRDMSPKLTAELQQKIGRLGSHSAAL